MQNVENKRKKRATKDILEEYLKRKGYATKEEIKKYFEKREKHRSTVLRAINTLLKEKRIKKVIVDGIKEAYCLSLAPLIKEIIKQDILALDDIRAELLRKYRILISNDNLLVLEAEIKTAIEELNKESESIFYRWDPKNKKVNVIKFV